MATRDVVAGAVAGGIRDGTAIETAGGVAVGTAGDVAVGAAGGTVARRAASSQSMNWREERTS